MEKYTADVINAVNHFKGLKKIKIAYARFEVVIKQLKFHSTIHYRIIPRTTHLLREISS